MSPFDRLGVAVLACGLLTAAGLWHSSARQYRRSPLPLLLPMLRLALWSRNRTMVLVALGTGAGYLLRPVVPALQGFLPPFPPPLVLGIVLPVLAAFAVPPTVLLLTPSGVAGSAMLMQLVQSLRPLRVVGLLRDHTRELGFSRDEIRSGDLRTHERRWRAVVRPLMDVVPIVVIDTRAATGPMVAEIGWMLLPERSGKAVFLVGPQGECPGIDAAVEKAPPGSVLHEVRRDRLRCVPAARVVAAVRQLLDLRESQVCGGNRGFGGPARCTDCGRPMQKLDLARSGSVAYSATEWQTGVRVAEECRECGTTFCQDCAPARPARCSCGADPETVRVEGGAHYRGSMRLIKVRYL